MWGPILYAALSALLDPFTGFWITGALILALIALGIRVAIKGDV